MTTMEMNCTFYELQTESFLNKTSEITGNLISGEAMKRYSQRLGDVSDVMVPAIMHPHSVITYATIMVLFDVLAGDIR